MTSDGNARLGESILSTSSLTKYTNVKSNIAVYNAHDCNSPASGGSQWYLISYNAPDRHTLINMRENNISRISVDATIINMVFFARVYNVKGQFVILSNYLMSLSMMSSVTKSEVCRYQPKAN